MKFSEVEEGQMFMISGQPGPFIKVDTELGNTVRPFLYGASKSPHYEIYSSTPDQECFVGEDEETRKIYNKILKAQASKASSG